MFVFKQKTAYELRISDWSSDVCSSDLPQRSVGSLWDRKQKSPAKRRTNQLRRKRIRQPIPQRRRAEARSSSASVGNGGYSSPGWSRSEEHTSELQSLMRISYAVFCLKKKKEAIQAHINTINTSKQ